jgi:hypothetical protein
LQKCLGPLFYRASIPGGLLTIWPTDAGWTAIGIPDREHPKGELRTVPVDGSNHRFRFRFHYPDDDANTADQWSHLIASARDG